MLLTIELDAVDESMTDVDHETGVTNECYERLIETLSWLGVVKDVGLL